VSHPLSLQGMRLMVVMERSERGPPRGEDKIEEEGRRLSRFPLYIALPPATLLYAYMY
jgi:hypothetical protein